MRRLVMVVISCSAALACTDQLRSPALGTAAQREALFVDLIEVTAQREAFSTVKNRALGFDPLSDMSALRDDVVGAGSEAELFYALRRLSNARRDRHLSLALVPGGLRLPDSSGIEVEGAEDPLPAPHASVRILPDYSTPEPRFFVSDVAADPGVDGSLTPIPGDMVLSVNGRDIDSYVAEVTPYTRHSTRSGLLWRIAENLPMRTAALPPSFYADLLTLELERADGERITVGLSYRNEESLEWSNVAEPSYPGFSPALTTPTYELLLPDDGRSLAVLRWFGFRETMVEDVDRLMDVASERLLLDHALVIDATRSRGGSRGAYAIQRFSPRPFKTTFGNLKISDVTQTFIDERAEAFARRELLDNGVRETLDDGTWLIDWLETDVRQAIERGEAYSNNVPFKLAHAPRESAGMLQPAEPHFRGPLFVLSGPRRGSHLDQFVSIIVDNDLGTVIGMPAGGYSNTWEWEEVVAFPGTDQPVVRFMWSIGHTIRPNGEILEGNPAPVHEYVPLTRENFQRYYADLLERVERRLGVA
jgi:hypothetical protein